MEAGVVFWIVTPTVTSWFLYSSKHQQEPPPVGSSYVTFPQQLGLSDVLPNCLGSLINIEEPKHLLYPCLIFMEFICEFKCS